MAIGSWGGKKPRILAHRGASGVAPENTMLAFELAAAAGADVLELDVHATRDGAIVVIHDPTVDRTTDGTGAVREMDLADLRRLDASARFAPAPGEVAAPRSGPVRVPLLEEVLAAFPDASFNIEIKPVEPAIEGDVLALLDRAGARDRTLLAAEDGGLARRIRALSRDLRTGMCAEDVFVFLTQGGEPGYAPPGVALQVPRSFGEIAIVTPEHVAGAHRVGLVVHVCTVDEVAELRELV
jgi:glycerophosphoryl diester phosphodiesterase